MGCRLSDLLPILAAFALLAAGPSGARRPADDRELRAWLENMVWYSRYTPAEIRAATGLEAGAIDAAQKRKSPCQRRFRAYNIFSKAGTTRDADVSPSGRRKRPRLPDAEHLRR
jgi:hypothetical protein